jgi:hypothetical protein
VRVDRNMLVFIINNRLVIDCGLEIDIALIDRKNDTNLTNSRKEHDYNKSKQSKDASDHCGRFRISIQFPEVI